MYAPFSELSSIVLWLCQLLLALVALSYYALDRPTTAESIVSQIDSLDHRSHATVDMSLSNVFGDHRGWRRRARILRRQPARAA